MRVLNIVALLAGAALLFCAQTAHAWWCLGHMATAQAAKSQMKPATIDYVEAVIATLSNAGPFPNAPDMVQVACWADDLKSPMQLKMMGDWHFIDQPYTPNNDPVPGEPVQNENIAKVISQLYSGIKANRANPKGWAMGFALSNLIHFVGDIHQPLHATELFNAEYPNGDAGGNGEIVYVDNTKTNLHAVWDSICWTWNDDLPRPLTPASVDTLETYVAGLLSKYTFTDAQIGVFDPMVMAQESFDLSVSTVYPGITNATVITQDYLNACLPEAEKRVALGGLRLGKQLQYLLGSFAEEWSANKKKGLLADMAAIEEQMLNKTLSALTGLKNRFEGTLRLRAEKLKVLGNKRKME